VILRGKNLNSAGPDNYRIQIEPLGRCVVSLVTATEIHCQPDLSSITETVVTTIKVSYSLWTAFVIVHPVHPGLFRLVIIILSNFDSPLTH